MFDIGWSELALIAVVALIAIGPKELPGVLRTVGQWMGKARKMASEFQGQFNEAMREAEMADLKKSFDDIKDAASGFTSGNIMTSLQNEVSDALKIDDINKPATSNDALTTSATDAPATSATDAPAVAATETPAIEPPIPETFTAADAHALASEPLAITQEIHPQPAPQDTETAAADVLKDAKAS